MIAFHQGKVDNFCALYAVLNAMQVLFNLKPSPARDILNRTLLAASKDYRKFSDILYHKTDYMELVDSMLDEIKTLDFPQLRVSAPLEKGATCEQIWEVLRSAAQLSIPRVSIFRIQRFLQGTSTPFIDHWTVGHTMTVMGLHFFDSSIEPGGIYTIRLSMLAEPSNPPQKEYIYIPPESVRILSTAKSAMFPI